MNKLFPALIVLICVHAEAATVWIALTNWVQGQNLTNQIKISTYMPPGTPVQAVVPQPIILTPLNGLATNVMSAGTYQLELPGVTPSKALIFTVPNNFATYSVTSLAVTNVPYVVQITAGSGISITPDTGQGDVTISATSSSLQNPLTGDLDANGFTATGFSTLVSTNLTVPAGGVLKIQSPQLVTASGTNTGNQAFVGQPSFLNGAFCTSLSGVVNPNNLIREYPGPVFSYPYPPNGIGFHIGEDHTWDFVDFYAGANAPQRPNLQIGQSWFDFWTADEEGSDVQLLSMTSQAANFHVPISGSGAGLTNLNASNLASGTVPTARLGSGPTIANTLLHGNSAWKPVDLVADVIGNLKVTHLNGGTGANSTTFWRGDGTWAPMTGYTMNLFTVTGVSPLALTTYYVGDEVNDGENTSYTIARIEIPKFGRLKRVYLKVRVGGALGSSEVVQHFIRINDTSDVAEIDAAYNTPTQDLNATVSRALMPGDFVALKVITPNWVTFPTKVRWSCLLYIE